MSTTEDHTHGVSETTIGSGASNNSPGQQQQQQLLQQQQQLVDGLSNSNSTVGQVNENSNSNGNDGSIYNPNQPQANLNGLSSVDLYKHQLQQQQLQQQQSSQQSAATTFQLLQNNLAQLQQHQLLQSQQQNVQSQHYAAANGPNSNNKQLVENAKNAIAQATQELFANGQQPNNANNSQPLHYSTHPQQQQLSQSQQQQLYGSLSPVTATPNDTADAQIAPYPNDPLSQQRFASMANLQQQLQQQQLQQQLSQHSGANSLGGGLGPNGLPGSQANQAFAQVLVANLPQTLTQNELAEIFSSLPSYERCGIACDPNNGLSIGRGWLVFSSTDHAHQAIAKMNGVIINGHTLHLSMMQPIGESTKSNIYVAGLPKQYSQSQLEQLFQTFGSIIESKILTDPSGVSRGVAFVRYDNSNSAAQAITAVNGHVMADGLHTYTIRVKFARDHHRNADPTLAMLTGQPQPNQQTPTASALGVHVPRSAAIYQSYIPPHIKARGEDISGGVALFVFHIPAEFTSRDLQELFAPCATVLSARIAIHPQTLESKGFGFVTVGNLEEAHQAVTLLNGRRVGRKFIKVSFKKQPSNPPQVNGMGGLGMAPGLNLSNLAGLSQSLQQGGHQHSNSLGGRGGSQLDPNTSLSSLAAALNLGSFGGLNQHSLGNAFGVNQSSWNGNNAGVQQPQSPQISSPTSPVSNLLNYNQQNLPLHLLMQQMQLGNAFPNSSFNGSNGNGTNSGLHSPQSNPQGGLNAGGMGSGVTSPQPSMYTYSPNNSMIQNPGNNNSGNSNGNGQSNSNWMPPSPISLPSSMLPQSALNQSQYHLGGGSAQQQQQQQSNNAANNQQQQNFYQQQSNNGQQQLFM